MEKFFYIYNYQQANYYILNDIPVLEVGKGSKGDIYVKFPRNEKSEEVFKRWAERSKMF